jgi:hypothetical protein
MLEAKQHAGWLAKKQNRREFSGQRVTFVGSAPLLASSFQNISPTTPLRANIFNQV